METRTHHTAGGHPVLRLFFAAVWLVNGLWCKAMDGVPRHREIVARILGDEHAVLLTRAIGAGEMLGCLA